MKKSELNRFKKLRQYLSEIEGEILSARELSKRLGVAQNLYGIIEREAAPPSKKVAVSLEEKYGISLEWFLTGEGTAPWDKETAADWFDFSEQIKKQVEEGKATEKEYKIHAGFGALSLLLRTKESELVDFFIEAAKNPEYRSYIFNVLKAVDALSKKKKKRIL